jgi:hypothetical protein
MLPSPSMGEGGRGDKEDLVPPDLNRSTEFTTKSSPLPRRSGFAQAGVRGEEKIARDRRGNCNG